MKRLLGLLALLSVISFTVVGCGRGSKGPSAKLTGTVKLDGKLVKAGDLSVLSEDGKADPAYAKVERDGTFTIAQAPVGKVKIGIRKPEVPVGGGSATIGKDVLKTPVKDAPPGEEITKDLGAAKKASGKAAGDKTPDPVVGLGGTPEERAEMAERAKSLEGLPEFYNDPQRSGLTITVNADGSTVYNIELSTKAKEPNKK